MAEPMQLLSRLFDVIECLSQHKRGRGVTQIAKDTGLNKSTVYRILSALVERGYAVKDEETQKYRLSMKFVQLSSLMLGEVELRTESYPYMKELAMQTHQSVHLAVLQKSNALYIEKVNAYNNIRLYSQIGQYMPLHSTGVGKVLTAWLPQDKLEETLHGVIFDKIMPNTIDNAADFLRVLGETRARGYAMDDLENEQGVRCVAAPIRDYTGQVMAAVSVSGAADQFVGDKLLANIDALLRTARSISETMGYHSEPAR